MLNFFNNTRLERATAQANQSLDNFHESKYIDFVRAVTKFIDHGITPQDIIFLLIDYGAAFRCLKEDRHYTQDGFGVETVKKKFENERLGLIFTLNYERGQDSFVFDIKEDPTPVKKIEEKEEQKEEKD